MGFKKSQNKLGSTYIIETVDITSDYVGKYDSQIFISLLKLEVNGKCPFDEFRDVSPKKVNKKKKILEEIDVYLTLLIEGRNVPPNKMHSIGSNEFEIRVKRTRLYLFFDPPSDNIIVLGHYNKRDDDQQTYINKFRELKTKYFSQKK